MTVHELLNDISNKIKIDEILKPSVVDFYFSYYISKYGHMTIDEFNLLEKELDK